MALSRNFQNKLESMPMSEEIFPGIFKIRVPLPHSPLGHLNSYLVKSEEKNLLIDTGLNFPEAFQSLCAGLSEAGINPKDLTEILLTHFHVDHIGLIPRFKEVSKNLRLSIHRIEAELSRLTSRRFEDYRQNMQAFLETNGEPSSIAVKLQRFHPAFFTQQAYQELATTALPLEDGQEISVGDYSLQVLWTPGHSPGHVCLYEPSLKALFSGDHILPNITPHVAQFMENMDPLTDYLHSLEKIEKLDVDIVLPAHEEAFTNHRERIKQLRDHHDQRLAEIINGLRPGRLAAYTLASKIHWNVNYKSWDEFPIFEKYLAVGETVAHLNLLEQKGVVRRTKDNSVPKLRYLYQLIA
jgi:glyoxylase-like metal-dependent hydrolase (beta-lactamase superfamily II)